MRKEEEIKKEIERLEKDIKENDSPLFGLSLIERKNTLEWVLGEENE